MRIIRKVLEMQQEAESWRVGGKKIALVPTMGYLHDGHLSLMKAARDRADIVVTSIFVNPTQFGPNEDLARYPRDFERDCTLTAEVGVDVIFAPEAEEIYPPGHQTYVEVTGVTQNLCGRSRPGHFRGVTTIVAKLFNIVKPHLAFFGEKDFQQLATIRRMVIDLSMDVQVVGHPIVREDDDLAMSSRNVFLNAEQRVKALRLNLALKEAQRAIDEGERYSVSILERVRQVLRPDGEVSIDYAQLCRPDTLEDVAYLEESALLALAVRVGSTRLIDNRVLTVKSS